MKAFEGKVCLVTGGASGIGLEICKCFSNEGATIAAIDNNQETLGRLIDQLRENGADAIGIELDVSQIEQVSKAFQMIEDQYERLDILVNCAGIIRGHSITEISEEEWNRVIDVNLKGTFLCTQAALRIMLRHSCRGKIINIASMAGKRGSGGWSGAHYAASKGGVIAFTKSVALQVAAHGINVNAVSPGPTATPLIDSVPDERKEAIRKSIPLGRLATPADIANAVLFLASDASAYIQGEIMDVDGGVVMD